MTRPAAVWKVPVVTVAEMYAAGVSLTDCARAAGVGRETVRRTLKSIGVTIRPQKPYQYVPPQAVATGNKTKLTLRAKVASLESQVRYWKSEANKRALSAKPPSEMMAQVQHWQRRAQQLEAEIDQWEVRWRDAVIRWRKHTGLSRVA